MAVNRQRLLCLADGTIGTRLRQTAAACLTHFGVKQKDGNRRVRYGDAALIRKYQQRGAVQQRCQRRERHERAACRTAMQQRGKAVAEHVNTDQQRQDLQGSQCADAGFAPSKRIRLLFGTNEETGCGDMSWYVSHGGELPVYGFTPDGEYPIINGEKGILNGTYSQKLHQTGDYRLTKFEGGAASNISPAYAAAELACPAEAASKIAADKVTVTSIEGGIRVEAEGIAVHGSTPEQGENAIGRLAQALNQLPLTGELGDCMAFVAERIGMEVHGESLGLAMRDELSGPLTLNLGMAKFEQETLSLVFSVRYPVTLKYDLVYPRLSRGFTLGGFTETEMTHAAAIYMPPESELIRRLSKVYEEQTGEKAELKSIGGGTYAKSMPNLVAFGPIFPGDEVREHKPDEYMEIERVLQNAEIIAAAMYELAK